MDQKYCDIPRAIVEKKLLFIAILRNSIGITLSLCWVELRRFLREPNALSDVRPKCNLLPKMI